MGISDSKSRRTSSSSYGRKSSDGPDVLKKINEKECVFIAMQSEIDKAITENNRSAMMSLTSEIAAHIMDLNQLKKIDITTASRGRAQKIIYNFELSLAKLKSICNYDTAMKKERDRHFSPRPSSSFYVEPIDVERRPDIVNDLIRFDSMNSVPRSSFREPRSSLPKVPESEINEQSRSNSLYSNQPTTVEEAFITIESEFDVLKDQAQRPVEDVDDYYQLDKGVFYLYVKVKNLELPDSLVLNERRSKLIKELTEFRALLDKKSGQLEEQRDINQEINTLDLLLDSVSKNEVSKLNARALEIHERVKNSEWDPELTEQKIELLRRLAGLKERIAYTNPSLSMESSDEHIYGNSSSLQDEIMGIKAQEDSNNIYGNVDKDVITYGAIKNNTVDELSEDNELTYEHINNYSTMENDVDNELDEVDDSIYGNVEIIKQNIESRIQRNLNRSGSSASQRGTIYVNADVVERNSAYENHVLPSHDDKMKQEVISKRPLPLPRNYDDKVINDLPKYWQRLNEIFDKRFLTDTEQSEVADIQRHAEVAKSLFERKIKRIMEQFEDSIEL